MNISEIDSNFKIETNLSEQDIVWQDAGGDSFVKYGVVKSDEDYLRMPRETARSICASGGVSLSPEKLVCKCWSA